MEYRCRSKTVPVGVADEAISVGGFPFVTYL